MLDGDSLAVGRIQRLIHIVDILGVGVMEGVELQNHLLGQTGCRRRDASRSGEVDMIVVACLLDVADFEDGPVHITIEAIAQLLCHVAQMEVVVGNLAQIDMLAEVGVGGVWGTILDGLSVSQHAIGRLTSGCTSEDTYLELAACSMLCFCLHSQFLCCCLGHTSRCKTTHGDVVAILNQCCSLGSGHLCISHCDLLFDDLLYFTIFDLLFTISSPCFQIRVQNY